MAAQHWALGALLSVLKAILTTKSPLWGSCARGRLKSELSNICIPVHLSSILLGPSCVAEPHYKGKKWVMMVRQEGKVIFSHHIPSSLHCVSPH